MPSPLDRLKRLWNWLIGTDPNPQPDVIDRPRQQILQQMLAEFRAFDAVDRNSETFKVLSTMGSKDITQFNRGEFYAFEVLLTKLRPIATQRREMWVLRERYRLAVGATKYAAYLGSTPPDPVSASEEDVRADALSLLSEIHRLNIWRPVREQIRNSLLERMTWTGAVLALILVGTIVVQWSAGKHFMPLVRICMLCGTIGGFISVQRRIQEVPESEVAQLVAGQFSVVMAPAIASVFSIVIYLLFAGKLLEGSLFPNVDSLRNFQCGVAQGVCSLSEFTQWTVDLAKLMVWAFAAGFAERLVPDTLDRLIARQQQSTAPTTGQTS